MSDSSSIPPLKSHKTPENKLAIWRRYYDRNPQKHRDRVKLWRSKNPKHGKELWQKYTAKQLAEDPEWASKRAKDGKDYRVENAVKIKSKDRVRRRDLQAIWCEKDPLPTQHNVSLDKQRGWLGEQVGLEWLRREGYINILHLSPLCQLFPFDFIAEKDSQKFLIDVTIGIVKKISPTKAALAKAFGAKGMILFVRPCGDFGYLASMEEGKKSVVVPNTIITQFKR